MCRQQLCNKLMELLDLMSFKGGACTIHLHLVYLVESVLKPTHTTMGSVAAGKLAKMLNYPLKTASWH